VSGLGDLARAWRAVPKQPAALKRCLSLLAALDDLGWRRSAEARAPVDASGAPLPWYTYPALLWLGPRLKETDSVFEYGAGNSTRWLAARVRRVTSVDHDARWSSMSAATAPPNASVLHRECSGDAVHAPAGDAYVNAIEEELGEGYDVVVVDGMARVSCVEAALATMGPSSLLVLDNSDRSPYGPALDHLAASGLARIDFAGPVPGSGRLSTTSVFGRDLTRWTAAHPPLPQLGYDASSRS
jgi:hypothetical protein